MPSHDQPKFW